MGSRVLLCKPSSRLTSLVLSPLSSLHLRFEPSLTITPSHPNLRFHRMAAKPSSSSSLTNGETDKPPAEAAVSPSASSAIDFLTLCHRLKTTKRAGWILRDVKQPESIADHMYRMGLMALIAKDIPGVDRDKCIKMAIVHDIAEAIVGDITPSDGVPKLEKSRLEREALDHMCKLLGGGSSAEEISELWMEYEENSSPEAKVVKDFDKVEMILQALEYEKVFDFRVLYRGQQTMARLNTKILRQFAGDCAKCQHYEQGKNLDEFFESTAGKFQTEVGKAWASEIASRRGK